MQLKQLLKLWFEQFTEAQIVCTQNIFLKWPVSVYFEI